MMHRWLNGLMVLVCLISSTDLINSRISSTDETVFEASRSCVSPTTTLPTLSISDVKRLDNETVRTLLQTYLNAGGMDLERAWREAAEHTDSSWHMTILEQDVTGDILPEIIVELGIESHNTLYIEPHAICVFVYQCQPLQGYVGYTVFPMQAYRSKLELVKDLNGNGIPEFLMVVATS